MSDGDHPILTTVGIVAVLVGLLMVFQPGLAAAIGTGYAAVTVVGLLALVQAIRVARTRQASELQATETPDVETVETMPTPGDEFDRSVAEIRSGPRRVLVRERGDLREALEEAALTAVAHQENCSREQASEYIEAGTWTDDAHAASFLGGADAPSPPLLDRVKIAASAKSPLQHRIRRTADAVAQAAGVVDDADADADMNGESNEGRRGDDETGDDGTGGYETSTERTRASNTEAGKVNEATETTGANETTEATDTERAGETPRKTEAES